MAHFPTRPRFRLPIKMDGGVGLGRELAPSIGGVSDQIGHDGVAVAGNVPKGPAANGPDVVLELAGEAGIESPVSRIVNPRRKPYAAIIRLTTKC